MKKLDLGQTVQVLANLGVIAGLLFVAIEIRTNTATNQISVYQTTSANWMQISSQVATDQGFAELLQKAMAGQSLNEVENLRFTFWANEMLTHGAFVRRLFESGVISEADFRMEFGGIRSFASLPAVRAFIEAQPSSGYRDLLLAEEEEFDRILRKPGALVVGE